MTSVCFYSGEQKENVSRYFMVFEMNYLNGSLNLSFSEIELWHPHVESEMNVSQLFISLLIWLSLQSHSFERCLLLSKLNQWSRCEMSDWKRERTKREFERKTRKSILKILLPLSGQSFFEKKKNQDNSRQQTSFLISYTPPQCLARDKRWLRKCCWRLLLEITNWLNLIKWFV